MGKKMDHKLVAKDEIGWIVTKHKVKRTDILKARQILHNGGYSSRDRLYAVLRAAPFNYIIKTKKFPSGKAK